MSNSKRFESLPNSGAMRPAPFVAASEQELILILQTWLNSHGGEKPPGLEDLLYSQLVEPAKKVVCTENGDPAFLRRFQFDSQYMGWYLEQENGAIYLVRPSAFDNVSGGERKGYIVWLGSDHGFSSDVFACTDDSNSPRKTFWMHDAHDDCRMISSENVSIDGEFIYTPEI